METRLTTDKLQDLRVYLQSLMDNFVRCEADCDRSDGYCNPYITATNQAIPTSELMSIAERLRELLK